VVVEEEEEEDMQEAEEEADLAVGEVITMRENLHLVA
jgi:hypothetical protein